MDTHKAPEVLHLKRNRWVPNSSKLPALIYREALPAKAPDLERAIEMLFGRNGWPAQWRNGVYPYHHFHSEGHEALGFAAGQAHIMLGGPSGPVIEVRAGDVVVLPAGVGHCNLGSSSDLLVVGAYPPGQHGDIVRSAPTPAMEARIASLPLPATDPVFGADGPLPMLRKSI